VAKLLETVHKSNLKINMILPAHGPVWRWNPYKIIELYQRWSEGRPADKALIVYDTMWGSTAKMAQAIAEGLKASGLNYKMVKISAIHRSDVAEEILEAGALIVGSPTLNANLLPTMADVLSYLEGLKRPNLVGAIFGSCGWANKAGEIIQEYLNRMKVELVAPPLSVKYVPDEQALKDCYNLGKLVAEKLKAKLVSF
jgi:flavorubredoxin